MYSNKGLLNLTKTKKEYLKRKEAKGIGGDADETLNFLGIDLLG